MPLLSEVIGKYISLQDYSSSEKSGICPFHNDKHLGNFMVNDRKNIWKCFACGATAKRGQDPQIAFIMQFFKISENDAKKLLMDRCSDYTEKKYQTYNYSEPSRLLLDIELLDKAYSAIFNIAQLSKSDKQYLQQRGITDFSDYCSFPLSPDAEHNIIKELNNNLDESFFRSWLLL